jgi:GH24 family phage-related lysozyme (muramidase)
MKQRRSERLERRNSGHARKHRRKAAWALSASVMGLGTAAMPAPKLPPRVESLNAFERRKPATLLSPSDELLQSMIEEEGAHRTVYRDVAGYPTVGVGHLVTPADHLQVGDRISRDQVLDYLDRDLAQAQQAVRRMVGDMPLYQNEYDALVDLAFNVGEGNLSPERSPDLNAAIAARDYDAIAAQLDYHHAAGRIARGLVYRSERRENIFTDASYADPRDADNGSASINI